MDLVNINHVRLSYAYHRDDGSINGRITTRQSYALPSTSGREHRRYTLARPFARHIDLPLYSYELVLYQQPADTARYGQIHLTRPKQTFVYLVKSDIRAKYRTIPRLQPADTIHGVFPLLWPNPSHPRVIPSRSQSYAFDRPSVG